MAFPYKFGFIGAGTMAEVIATGMIKQGLCTGKEILLSNRSAQKLQRLEQQWNVAITQKNDEVIEKAQYILLAVKPQQFGVVCQQLTQKAKAGQAIISIMAGVSIETIEKAFPGNSIFRAMPNTPAKIGWGMTGVAGNKLVNEIQKQVIEEMFNSVGKTLFVEEAYMDGLCAVSGSGPAYVYQMIEAIADGAVLTGLPRAMAYQLTAQTIAGAAMMLLETGEHPGVLKDQVTSPGGTTIRALKIMEEKGVRNALMEAVQQAYIRSKELGKDE